jgi:hypothetical protein
MNSLQNAETLIQAASKKNPNIPFISDPKINEILHHWARKENVTEELQAYYPSLRAPIDMLEDYEYRLSQKRQSFLSEKKWGVAIGIRYFKQKDDLPPIFMSELFLFKDLLKLIGLHEEERKLYHFSENKNDQDFFNFLGFLETSLAGESAEKTKYKYHYKHYLADTVQQTYLRTYYENLARDEIPVSKIIIPYVLNIENKTVILKKKLHRHMKWKILQLHRESQAVDQQSKFKMWHVIVKFCIDFVTGRIMQK